MHPHLCRIFARQLAPGGRLLLADPFRGVSLRLLERLDAEGWGVRVTRWTLGDEQPRVFGVFEVEPPSGC